MKGVKGWLGVEIVWGDESFYTSKIIGQRITRYKHFHVFFLIIK
jgi:hypothetical protein